MGALPVVSGNEFIDAVSKLGYSRARQRGSHVIMELAGRRPLVVPLHRELKPGTLRGLIRDAGLTVNEFLSLLR